MHGRRGCVYPVPMIRPLLTCFLLAAIPALVSSCSTPSDELTSGEKFFVNNVKPILEQNCLACHNTDAHPSRLNLSGPGTLRAARYSKPFIVSGRPDDSLLISAVSRNGSHPNVMPRLDLSLTEDQVAVLREWIQDGAAWPDGPEGKLAAKANPER